MNKQTIIAIVVIMLGWIALEAHEQHTEKLIAAYDAQQGDQHANRRTN